MLSVEFAAKLVAAGLTTGYTVSRGQLLATPDKMIAVTESGGSTADVAFGDDVVENPTVQVLVRGEAQDYDGPAATAEAIYQAALSWGAFVQSSVRYLEVTPAQPPFPLTRDGNERVVFSVNFMVEKELS